MNSFNWAKAILYGIAIWGVAALVLAGLSLTNISDQWAHGLVALAFGITAYLFAVDTAPNNLGQALGYGVSWLVVGLALDGIVMRNFDAHIFATWQYWLGYALLFLAPLFSVESTRSNIIST